MDENALGGAIEKLKDMLSSEDGQSQIQDIIGMFSSGGDEEPSNENVQNSGNGFDPSDMEMLFKIQQMARAMNDEGGSKHAQFLSSLRPYLKESRQKKLDGAVKLLGAANAMKMFGILNRGGDDN